MNRIKPFLFNWISLLVLGASQVNAADSKPNVLFLAVDDMNDWIGCLEASHLLWLKELASKYDMRIYVDAGGWPR